MKGGDILAESAVMTLEQILANVVTFGTTAFSVAGSFINFIASHPVCQIGIYMFIFVAIVGMATRTYKG